MQRSPKNTTAEIDHSPLEYRIKVLGYLDEEWSDNLNGLQISTDCREGKKAVTTLSGLLSDQSALFGVLNFLYNHRFRLLSVNCLSYSEEQSDIENS